MEPETGSPNADLAAVLRKAWGARDPETVIDARERPDGKLDVTVISRCFEGLDGLEREALFWPAFEYIPMPALITMTYCLLLTPDEAERHFSGEPSPPTVSEDWDS